MKLRPLFGLIILSAAMMQAASAQPGSTQPGSTQPGPKQSGSAAAQPTPAKGAAMTSPTQGLAMARPIMHALVFPMRNLLGIFEKESLSDEEFKQARTNLLQVKAQIASMRHFSKALGADYQKVSSSMLEDLQRAEQAIAQKKPDQLKFFLKGAVQHCATCHVKSESKGDFAGFKGLIDGHVTKNNAWKDKLDLMISLRQFIDASKLMEEKIADSQIPPQTLDMYNIFYTYLKVNIQTQGNYTGPLKTLQAYAKARGSILPDYHRDEIQAWIKSLEVMSQRKDLASLSIDECKKLLDQGWAVNEQDFSQKGLVDILTAAKRLQELSMESNKDKAARAQAYRMLGQVAERYADTIWYAESHSYYESSIQTLPHSPVAQAAYKNLEELIVFEHSGSAGTMIPLDTQKNLEKLKKMAF